ncbi:MAG: PIN domain nuclease [Thermoprotei archaeon]|nr:MAG: PIN domain nuclease [Thermoprotei archaeon]
MIVIDASALAKYVLHEENWHIISSYIRKTRPLYSVDHVVKEVGNAIWRCHLRRIIGREDAIRLYNGLLRLVETGVIILESEMEYVKKALEIALEHGITLYDSLYVAQAMKYGELLTSDVKQAEVASKMGIKVYLEM